MTLHDRGVAPERPPQIEVLTLDDPLSAGDLTQHDRTVNRCIPVGRCEAAGQEITQAEPDEQRVLEADEESRFARIALTSSPAAQPRRGLLRAQFIFGDPGDKMVAAEWAARGAPGPESVGLFRPSNCTSFLRFTNSQGVADQTIVYGMPTGAPVAGDFGVLPGGGAPPPGCPVAPVPPPPPPPPPPGGNCDPAYPTVCIPSPPPDLDCTQIVHRRFTVLPPDPHGFDADGNGIGCESG